MQSKVSEKATRLANELFRNYQDQMSDLGFYYTDALDPHKIKCASNMVKELGMVGAKEVILFAITNWALLRECNPSGKQLLEQPNFYQITAVWNYTKWIQMIQNNEIVQIEKKELYARLAEHEKRLKTQALKDLWKNKL